MTIKNYLSQFIKLDKIIDSSFLRVEELKKLSLKSRSYISAANTGGDRASSIERTVEKIEKAVENLNRDIDKYFEVQGKIENLISLLDNYEERALLERHYILGQTWEKIAEECFLSLRTVYYMHNKALKGLEPFYENSKERAAG
jgi:DNA-directed RNA polymerase specialized sigma subunit